MRGNGADQTDHDSIRWSRRRFLTATVALGASAGLAACQPPVPTGGTGNTGPAAPAPKPDGWDEIVRAAKAEGSLIVYAATSPDVERVFVEDFGAAYPEIKLQGVYSGGNDIVTRVMAERQAGRYIPDVVVTGSFSMLETMKPQGIVAPLQSAFMLPEVSDSSKWLQNTMWWADTNEPYTTLNFQGLLATPVFVNPTLVDPNSFTSYWDFVDPKWKGKIVSNDIRQTGPGGVPARFIYKHPDLGGEWFERLYGEMDVTISSDQRQMVDWLVQGRFPILLFVSNNEFVLAKQQGLPISVVPIETFKEGGAIGPGGGSLAWFDRAPHPNAAKVFINWLLSREGQTAWQKQTKLPSLRIDIPKEGLIEEYVPKRNYTYVDGGSEEYGRVTADVFRDLITRALDKAVRS